MIPKIIHQIWIGNNTLPARCKGYIDSIKKNFKEYDYIMWDDDKVALFLKEFFPKVFTKYNTYSNNAEKSDIARYCILYKLGGFYFDIDYECFKSFSEIINFNDYSLFVFYDDEYFKDSFGLNNIFTNSVIGATPDNNFIKQLIDSILSEIQYKITKKLYARALDKIDDTICKTGPILYTQVFQRLKKDKNIFIGSNYQFINKTTSKEEKFGQHHCIHSWL